MAPALGELRIPSELKAIDELLTQKKLAEAHAKATALIERASSTYPSTKQESLFKGQAYYLRGIGSAERGDDEASLEDMKRAAHWGHPFAPYQVAGRLTVQASSKENPTEREADLQEAHRYGLMGAELGDLDCIGLVQIAFRARGQVEDEHYWFLLERMSEGPEKIRQFQTFYSQDLNSDDRRLLDKVMRESSLSKGQYTSTVPGLPGRSTLTAAFVDLCMRKQLRFTWRAFFQEDAEANACPLRQVCEHFRRAVRTNPLADVWLLVHRRYHAGEEAVFLDTDQLLENMLPGDEIAVRCGRLSHYAIIWDVDPAKNSVWLLDPFDAFWQPSHNRAVTVFERQPHGQGRHLVRVLRSELKPMLVAVFSIRDRQLP